MRRRNLRVLSWRWLERGNSDLKSARLLLRGKGPADTICFLCQQAAEKYLKGFLVYKNVKPARIHDLVALAQRCQKKDKDFREVEENCRLLNDYYIKPRYPIGITIKYSSQKAKEALRMAEEIIDLVKKKCRK